MKTQINKLVFFILDIIIVSLSFFVSFLLRFDFKIPLFFWNELENYLPTIIISKLFSCFIFGLYRGMWRYTSLSDLINILKASSLGSLISLSILSLVFGLSGFPRSVFFIDYIFCSIGLSISRMLVRLYYNNYNSRQIFNKSKSLNSKRKKIIIIGAGNSSEKLKIITVYSI